MSGIFAFTMIIMITHFFDYLHSFLEHRPSIELLMSYFCLRIPEWFVTIIPVSMLLGVLFSLGMLKRNNEITAIKSSGIKLSYVLKPLIIFSIIASISSCIIYESIVPKTSSAADRLFLIIRNRDPKKKDNTRENFTYMGENKRLYHIEKFEDETIIGLNLIEFFPESLQEQRRITAKKAVYTDGYWKLLNASIRTFKYEDGLSESFQKFDTKELYLPEKPSDFQKPVEKIEQMDFFSLLRYIKKLKKGGLSTVKERVLLHYKISFPFSNTIILILGIPIALWGGLKSRTTGFFISIIICFIYWGTISIGRALGVSGFLPPFAGAWSANIIFFLISIFLMKYSEII